MIRQIPGWLAPAFKRPQDGADPVRFGRYNRGELYGTLVLIAAVALVFMPVIGFGFLNYDDPLNVCDNPLVTHFSWANIRRFWSSPYEGLYIPLTYSLWVFLAGLSGLFSAGDSALQPAIFHAANLLVHLASVLVVFRLLRQLLNNDWAAVAGALLFGLHPIQVEAVAWVTGMKDLLGGFFSILALERFLFYVTAAGGRDAALRRYGLASLVFVLALLAKPSAMTVPLLAGVIAYFCLGRSPKVLLGELLPWLLLAIPVLIVARASQPIAQISFDLSWWQRLLVVGDSLSFYLAKLFWPFGLGPDYGRIPTQIIARGWAYVSLLPPLVVAGMLCWKWRSPWLRAGGLLFFLAPLPVLGLVAFDFQNISTVADRYLYLAMVGPGLLTASLLCRFRSRLVMVMVFAGLALLALESRLAVGYWQDSLTFNRHALLVNPDSSISYRNLGIALVDSGNFREALSAYRRAIEIDPNKPDAYLGLGNAYAKVGMSREAIASYQKALSIDPRNLGLVYRKTGLVYRKMGDAYESLGEYDQALNSYSLALYNYRRFEIGGDELARLHIATGLLYKNMGRNAEAIESYRQALLEKPDFAEAMSNLGVIYGELGRVDEAEKFYRGAVTSKPTLAEPYNNLGLICLGSHREQEAVALFSKAVALAPHQPTPAYNLGNAYLALGQFEPALAAFQQALKSSPGFTPALNGIAQVYRRMGRSDLAGTYDAEVKAPGRDGTSAVAGAELQGGWK